MAASRVPRLFEFADDISIHDNYAKSMAPLLDSDMRRAEFFIKAACMFVVFETVSCCSAKVRNYRCRLKVEVSYIYIYQLSFTPTLRFGHRLKK